MKFRVVGRHLNLEIYLSEINFSTGRIVEHEKSFWHSSDAAEAIKRTEITLKNPDIPTKSKTKSLPISNGNTYVKFTHTDMGKDASQNTVPYLDAQDVVNNPPVPIQGVSIILKAQDGYGGFIAPRIKTFDYGPYVQPIEAPKK